MTKHEILKSQIPGFKAGLCGRRAPNDTCAYMLIYIRESEREAILQDEPYCSLPESIQRLFKEEAIRKTLIEKDSASAANYKTVYMLSNETLLNAGWDGQMLAGRMGGLQAEFCDDYKASFQISVDKQMSINQFIKELHDRFFAQLGVAINDIWLYRIATPGGRKVSLTARQHLFRVTYDEVNNLRMPLFSRRVGLPKLQSKQT